MLTVHKHGISHNIFRKNGKILLILSPTLFKIDQLNQNNEDEEDADNDADGKYKFTSHQYNQNKFKLIYFFLIFLTSNVQMKMFLKLKIPRQVFRIIIAHIEVILGCLVKRLTKLQIWI